MRNIKRYSTYPLRLPRSIKAEVERLAKQDGISINQFIALAVAEKVSALRTADFFAERRARADFAAFDRMMRRQGGEEPGPDDRWTEICLAPSCFIPAKAERLSMAQGADWIEPQNIPLPRMNSGSCEERRKCPKQYGNHDQSLHDILLAARSCNPDDIDPMSDPCA